jgi:hypothetical protein
MATTDSRTGFRLPWGSDQRPPTDEATEAAPAGGETTEVTNGQWTDHPPVAEDAAEGDHTMSDATAGAVSTDEGDPTPPSGKSPAAMQRTNKFLADLTKAMQVAAESAREETMGRLQAEAKTSVEQIHERSATEAADLRRQADDDVASIREWSKAEIARIREETDQRIAQRKGRLEQEIEEHAAYIERRMEKVQGRVSAFEAEMASFFERLLAEEDPTRFAAMAENLPEPPPFDADEILRSPSTHSAVTEQPARATIGADDAGDHGAADPVASMAAIQAAAEAAEPALAEVATPPAEPEASYEAPATEPEAEDPRLAAFGGSADFAAAEAEAAAAVGSSDMSQEIPTIADDALAARLAGLVPGMDESAPAPAGEAATTQIVVTGLVSVASIASFKRHLGRVPGVQSVGVSSGPEGEFIFAVHHGPEVILREAIPGLPGFRARVTGGKDSTVEVAAHDPESGA